jgi:CopA family copper-resistance protein
MLTSSDPMRLFALLLFLLGSLSLAAQTPQHQAMPKSKAANGPATPPPDQDLRGHVVAPRTGHAGHRVEYDLYVDEREVSYTGKTRLAIAINGQIPAPTLRFTEGDTAIIRVHNQMSVETSIHWHGLLLPNDQDGVPYLNTAPIEPGGMHTFTFPLIQSGTYWYHSHTMLQEQNGLYGSIVIQPKQVKYELKEYVLLLSDWTDHPPKEVLRYLKRAGEWFAVQKGATQSYGEAVAAGYFKDKVRQEWGRMPAMDLTDIYYNKFLTNGREQSYYPDAKPGEVVRLRVINGSASSYFYLQYAGGPMQVIAADGINVEPFPVSKLEIATAETYDLLVTIPPAGAAELRATANDITGYSSSFFGAGEPMKAPDLPRINYFQMMREMGSMGNMTGMDMGGNGQMDPNGGMKGMDMKGGSGEMKGMNMPAGRQSTQPADPSMKGMDMKNGTMPASTAPSPQNRPMNMQEKSGKSMGNTQDMGSMAGMDMGGGMAGMSMGGAGGDFNYNQLRALNPTTLDSTRQWRDIKLTLTGNMLRYIWSFDNKTLSEADKIPIRRGENVRMTFTNLTMMRHPLHLHGHFFRLVNAQGAYSPMKHTFDIPAMGTVTIEFEANEYQDWFFHCHILYHMMAGMARIISYDASPQNEYAKGNYKMLKREDNAVYPWLDLSVHSQGAFLEGNLSNNRNALEFEGRVNYLGNYETETHLLRYLDKRQFWAAFVGYDFRDNKTLRGSPLEKGRPRDNNINFRRQTELGVYYLLPLLVRAELRSDLTGQVRLQLERRDLPLSNNVFMDIRGNTDREFTLGFRYMVSKYASLSTNYDNQYGWGAGLTFHY